MQQLSGKQIIKYKLYCNHNFKLFLLNREINILDISKPSKAYIRASYKAYTNSSTTFDSNRIEKIILKGDYATRTIWDSHLKKFRLLKLANYGNFDKYNTRRHPKGAFKTNKVNESGEVVVLPRYYLLKAK